MRFRNTRTGAIIDVSSRISGPWEPVEDDNTPVTSQVSPEPETVEETEAEKKPRARKRRKQ